MAKSDILVRWKADTSNYDANIAKAKRQLEGFADANYSAGGVMKQMTSQLVATAAKFATLSAAAAGAMKVIKDAFGASEAMVDEWGRTMAASKSLYEGFLTSINNGDVSGFLGRIDQIVTAARAAYDELDKLGSLQTIQAPKVSAQQAENTRFRMMLMTGKWIGAAGANNMGMKEGQALTPAQLKVIQGMLENGTKTLVRLTGNEVKQAGKTIDAFYERYGKELGMSVSEFRKGTSSWEEFSKRLEGAARYQQWESSHTATVSGTMGTFSIGPRERNPYAAYQGWDTFRVDGERYKELVDLIQRRDQMASSMYSQQGQAYRSINRAETRINGRGGGGGGRGSGSAISYVDEGIKGVADFGIEAVRTSSSIKELRDQLAQYQAALMGATNATDYRAAAAGVSSTGQKLAWTGNAMRLGVDVDDLVTQTNEAIDAARGQIKPIEITAVPAEEMQQHADAVAKDGKNAQAAWQAAAGAISTAGSALSSLDNPSAKIAGLVGQAIANIALGFAQAAASPATTMAGVWGWIAAAVSGLATMTATIASIKSVTAGSYAEGGIVPGNNYSGDNMIARVNSGEVILNAAQQNNLASRLQGGGGAPVSQPYVSGEQIYLGLNNYLRRSGRGEMITTR